MIKPPFNILVVVRVLIGGLLLFSGFQKAVLPYQNFLYVIQTYNFLPTFFEDIAARIVPWAEIIIGVFLMLGFWLRAAASVGAVLFVMFVAIISQALIRGLPIGECGCFGESFSVPPAGMIVFDTITLVFLMLIISKPAYSGCFSLDRYFER